MRVSYRWLKDYADPGVSPEELADMLTMAGVAVGGIEHRGRDVRGVLVGEVVAVDPHPGADRLYLCRVHTGNGTVQVVTGATNVTPGCRVPVAVPGSVLPGGRTIEVAQFRGQRSEGMLCSARELGLPEDRPEEEAGIFLLPADAPVGQDIVRYLGLDDSVLVLDLTPNRADCLSMVGVAREVAAVTGCKLLLPSCRPREEGAPMDGTVRIDVEAPDLCPRYSARLFTDVAIGPSPLWMQRRLQAAGVRPINNVVDITNYVMLELGQPLHAFDYDLIGDRHIIVRRAHLGERMVTLDGVDRLLSGDMLVIADAGRAVGIAGVMGGENTEVTPGTRRVLLEAAHFDGLSIRRTARRLGLRSEAAARFEKGVDPNGTVNALDRAAQLLEEMGAGVVARGVVDVYPAPVRPKEVMVRPARVNECLGTSLRPGEMSAILRRLGFEVARDGNAALRVTVPTRRPDIRDEVDLAEEVGRLYGYDRIPTTLPEGIMTQGRKPHRWRLADRAADYLVACGLTEVVTYSFANPAVFDRLGLPPDHPWRRCIRLRNPMSEEQSALRTSLVPGVLDTMSYNAARQVEHMALFEIGVVYLADRMPLTELPEERLMLVVAAIGRTGQRWWGQAPPEGDFYYLKGVLAGLAREMGVDGWRTEAGSHPLLHPGRTARLYAGDHEVGYLGEVHPEVAGEYDLSRRPAVAEVDFDFLVERARPERTYRPLPRFPSTHRDLAVIVPEGVPAERVTEVIRACGGELLRELVLFDVYRGAPVPAGHRSLAYSLLYRADDRTLTDEEVEEVYNRIREALCSKLGAQFRS